MLTSEKILSLMQQHQQHRKQYGVKRLGLFGSYGRDTQIKQSDVDILVGFYKGKKNL